MANPRISIVGDSYSTYAGTPGCTSPHYPAMTQIDAKDQWWVPVIESVGGRLEVNCAEGGSRIASDDANSFLSRVRRTGLGNPDAILIMGGPNDDWNHETAANIESGTKTLFAYLDEHYPAVRKHFVLNALKSTYNRGMSAEARTALRNACEAHGYPVTDLQGVLGTDATDLAAPAYDHPTASGLAKIGAAVLETLKAHPLVDPSAASAEPRGTIAVTPGDRSASVSVTIDGLGAGASSCSVRYAFRKFTGREYGPLVTVAEGRVSGDKVSFGLSSLDVWAEYNVKIVLTNDRNETSVLERSFRTAFFPSDRFTHVWSGGTGSFSDASKWNDASGSPAGSAPSAGSHVNIPSGEVSVTAPFAVAELVVSGGTVVWDYGDATTPTVASRVTGDVTLTRGTLKHAWGAQTAAPWTVYKRLFLEVDGDMTVGANASVTAQACGYPNQQGPGAHSGGWGGGWHGGCGAEEGSMTLYGSIRAPLEYGSGCACANAYASRGGGAVRLKVGGTLKVDGSVNANGEPDKAGGGGSGAGGSVYITAGEVVGVGEIAANAQPYDSWTSGGGGRVSIVETTATTSVFTNVSAYGLGSGTVYRENAADEPGVGSLALPAADNSGGGAGGWGTWLDASMMDGNSTFKSVRLGPYVKLLIVTGFTLNVREGWSADPTACVRSDLATLCGKTFNGSVAFTGDETLTLSGPCTFYNLSCAQAGKTILFGTAPVDVCRIADGGTFAVQGTAESPISLLPATAEGTWNVAFGSEVVPSVRNVRIKGSVANVESSARKSTDLGGNVNWNFGFTHVWKGGTGSFSDASMWLDEDGQTATAAPDASSTVSIAGGTVSVTAPFTVAALSVSGGTVSWNYGDETTPTVASHVTGDVKLTGGTLTHTGSYLGSAPWTVYRRIFLEVGGRMTVGSGALVDATGKGYYGDAVTRQGSGAQKTNWGGGAHGGLGGGTSSVYGSVRAPAFYGSPGVKSSGAAYGGGAIRLVVAGTLTNDGAIRANGQSADNGGTAGGSVFVTAGAVTGSGVIEAKGVTYNGKKDWTAGGGGRVSIVETTATTSTAIAVDVDGCSAGTIYYENASDTADEGTLVIGDNVCGSNGGFGTPLNGTVTDGNPAFGAVKLGENAKLLLVDGFTLNVRSGWTAVATASVPGEANNILYRGAVAFVGSEPLTLSGVCVFKNFPSVAPGKVLRFATGANDVCRISDGGTFFVHGTAAAPISLLPATAGGTWNIEFGANVVPDVQSVRLQGSVANVSATALKSVDLGGNTNWHFVYTHTWKGGTGSFSDASMWQDADGQTATAAPDAESSVSIAGGTVSVNAPFSVASLAVSGGTVTWNYGDATTPTVASRVTGDVTLTGGTLTHTGSYLGSAPWTVYRRIFLEVGGGMTVGSGALVDATGKGYYGDAVTRQGPGAQKTNWGGGAHGGLGGGTSSVYGSVRAPAFYGSPGVKSSGAAYGGGAIRLVVAGTLTNDGAIRANGQSADNGGTAGGSVFVTVGAVTGSGVIEAKGVTYNGKKDWTAGGGGRVSIVETTATTSTAITVDVDGCSAGTIYYENASDTADEGTLVIGDNVCGSNGGFGTPLDGAVTDGNPAFGSVKLGENAKLLLVDGFTLNVRSGWMAVATASVLGASNNISYPGSVAFVGSEPLTLSGLCKFYNLSCSTAGKMLRFAGASGTTTLDVLAGGSLVLNGAAGGLIVLEPEADDATWSLTLEPGASQNLRGISVKNSDASSGQKALARGVSANRGGNTNWQFPKGLILGFR